MGSPKHRDDCNKSQRIATPTFFRNPHHVAYVMCGLVVGIVKSAKKTEEGSCPMNLWEVDWLSKMGFMSI